MPAKALIVIGTRPEAIKLAPVIGEMRRRGAEVVVCSTGQHRDMVRPILDLFDIEPDHDLALMRPNQTLTYLAGAATHKLGEVITREQPDVVVVQGDTTTAFAGALAAFYCRTPVAHVEAGLRTGDPQSPWPEEINRVLTARLTDVHFAPTERARDNLIAEGVDPTRIEVCGNTVVDAALDVARRIGPERAKAFELKYGFLDPWRPMVLFTMHRRESLGAPMEEAFRWVRRFAATHPVQVLFPVHPNPRVRQPAEAILGDQANVFLVDPLEYDEMIHILQRTRFVITDSGGLVEEAPTFRKPALVTRESTERPESIEAGLAVLCGGDFDALWRLSGELLEDGPRFAAMSAERHPFGDGHAAERIAETLIRRRREIARAA